MHTVQGFWVSMLPQVSQTRIFSIAICSARGERRHQRLALLDQMQRRAPRRARAKPRQPRQQLDQAFDFGSGNGRGHVG